MIASLCDFAAEHPRKKLIASDMHAFLSERGLQARRLVGDQRTSIRMDELRQDFVDSIEPHLASGQMIPRPEADAVFSMLETNPSPDVVIVHGPTGFGKSGVLYQVAEGLRNRRMPFVAVRLDRRPPRGTARQFGKDLGLPESPVICLEQLAAGGRAVLILDQLDSLRWTSAHAAQGLDVCKELVREVRTQRAFGRNLTAVIACRTFDLQHDPEIRRWLTQTDTGSFKKIEVQKLPDAAVREIVRESGVDPDRLTARRLSLLASVQNLAMWAEIVRSETDSPDFDSATQLMREFWRNRRREIEKAGVSPSDRDDLLDLFVDHMEQHATLSAPARLTARSLALATQLQSLGIIQVSGRSVTFCHQSYLDFLIADRAAAAIDAGSLSLLEWLGDRSRQSLFRREQLRQLLFLLADENMNRFVSAVHELLSHPETRFHMKLLTLEALGQVTPTVATSELVLKLLREPEWSELVLQLVVQVEATYVADLAKAGALQSWLSSPDDAEQSRAIGLLSTVIDRCGDLVAELCLPLLEQGAEKVARIALVLRRSSPDTETDGVFALRLACIRAGALDLFVAWKDLAEQQPARALRLLAVLATTSDGKTGDARSHKASLRMENPADAQAVSRAAARRPKLAWKLLQPRLIQVVKERPKRAKTWAAAVRIPRVLIAALRASGRRLASRAPDAFLSLVRPMSTLRSRVVRKLLVDTLTALPQSYADVAIRWLLEDPMRLRCGAGRRRARWVPARRLVAAMSPHCCDEVFADVERVLLRYRDPEERRLAQFWFGETRRGDFRNRFGGAQYFLLPALCATRRSQETNGRIGVLERKFGEADGELFAPRQPRGGLVTSPIDQQRIDRVSDVAWLAIITNGGLASRRDTWRVRRYQIGSVLEASVEMFSRDFGKAALRDPVRFARLALQIPLDAPPDYLGSVLHALARRQLPSDVPEDRRATWSPAPAELVQCVLERMPCSADRQQAEEFCRILESREDIIVSATIVEHLLDVCGHADPEPDSLQVYCNQRASECAVEVLEQNSINCVRAIAARSMSAVLFRSPELLPQFLPAIERFLGDPHPVVRVAAVRICLAVWNIDQSISIAWLLRAVADDLRVAACHDAQELYNFAFPDHAADVAPLVQMMISSQCDDVATTGTGQVTARNLFYGLFSDELQLCTHGSVVQRKAVAATAARLLTDPRYFESSRVLLEPFFNDPEDDVRAKAALFLRYDRFLENPDATGFLLHFVRTLAFHGDPNELLYAVERSGANIAPLAAVILDACKELCQYDATNPPSGLGRRPYAGDQLGSLLLRLYEQSEGTVGTAMRQSCLDAWDELLRSRVTPVVSLTRQLDK
ncbi:MAG TPA: hypothetical protein VMV69_30255 [Pirellulales bacterium]|nr:hypothetical protein [Pirellulales bacterium]